MSSPTFSLNRYSASLGERELLGADLVNSPITLSRPSGNGGSDATDDEVDVLGEVIHEVGHRLVRFPRGDVLIVIEHHNDPLGQLGELVYERGSIVSTIPRPPAPIPTRTSAPKPSSSARLAARLDDVSPQPDRSLSCSSRETHAKGSLVSSIRRQWAKSVVFP